MAPAREGAAAAEPGGRSEVLLIGGRSGVGKSTAADAVHALLTKRDVAHAAIEGDALDLAHPTPWLRFPQARLAERNLAAMWLNYRALGYRRLVYTNTAAVVSVAELTAAMGDDPRVVAVLLQASDATAAQRLGHRALGEADAAEIDHSARTALRLERDAAAGVHRLHTDGRTPAQLAAELVRLTGW